MRTFPAATLDRLRSGGDGLRILIVRLGAFGDVLRTLPALCRLRRAFPDARFEWAVDQSWAPFFACVDGLGAVHAFPRTTFKQAGRRPAGWPEAVRIARSWRRVLRGRSFELAIDFHGNLRAGVSSRFSAAPIRLGYEGLQQKEGNRWFQTHRLRLEERRQSRIERNLALADVLISAAGRPEDKSTLSPVGFRWPRGVHSAVPREGKAGGYAVVAPTVSRSQAYKMPPTALLSAAIGEIKESGLQPWIAWGPGELPQAKALAAACEGTVGILPDTDLLTLGATIAGARLFVGGDTGPMHLACACAVPTLAIYGPTDPQINAPWSPRHEALSPVGRTYTGIKRTDRKNGFEGLGRSQVQQAVKRLLTDS